MIKTVMVLINLIVAVLFFTVLYSAANIDVSVNVDTRGIDGFVLENNSLKVSIPVDIKNDGLYPIENVHIGFNITNGSQVIYGDQFRIRRIDSLHEYNDVFVVSINLLDMYQRLGEYYLFHQGVFRLNINVSARYWILADFNAVYSRNISWQPLIHTYRIYRDEITFDGEEIIVPYFISKLPVHVNATMDVVIRDNLGVLGKGTEKVVFDRKAYMKIRTTRSLDYLIDREENWMISVKMNINGLDVVREIRYHWTPPISNLSVVESVQDGKPVVCLVFRNNANTQLHFTIEKRIIHDGVENHTVENVTLSPGEYAKIVLFALLPGHYQVYVNIILHDYGMEKSVSYEVEV